MILPASGNKEANQINSLQGENSISYAKKIVLANKGEAGYSAYFDLNDDGVVTLDEFNQYCEENGISGEDRLKLMMVMQQAKVKEDLAKDDDEENDGKIYAKRGEEKYVEEMDENKDGTITYDEYIKYCQEYANSNDEKEEKITANPKMKEAIKAYCDNNIREVQMEVDSEA